MDGARPVREAPARRADGDDTDTRARPVQLISTTRTIAVTKSKDVRLLPTTCFVHPSQLPRAWELTRQ